MDKLILLALLLGFTVNAYALTELEVIDELEPISGPDQRNVGWQWHFIDQDGKPGYMEKVAGDNNVASYIRTDGCEWTRATSGFAPATEWSNCPSTGTSTVDIDTNSLWPLKKGNRIVYTVRGTSSLIGRAWSSKRSCEVTKLVKIEITSGVFDTFKVECKERWGSRTWWLSPTVGTAVAYQQTTRRGTIRQEMVKIVRP